MGVSKRGREGLCVEEEVVVVGVIIAQSKALSGIHGRLGVGGERGRQNFCVFVSSVTASIVEFS